MAMAMAMGADLADDCGDGDGRQRGIKSLLFMRTYM